ncbi:MAG: OmpA family protein [Candidatus Krumholzibacteria bacterium]|nr:OmpA family protein [Candidatus Krumholzibacteria bacterium]
MRFFIRLGAVAVALALAAGGAVRAQTSWDGTAGLLRVYEAGTVGKGKLVFSLGTAYQRWSDETLLDFPGSFYSKAGGEDPRTVTYNLFVSRAGLTLGLNDNIELAATLDVRNWIMQVPEEFETEEFETFYRGGLGDTRVMAKLCPPLPVQRLRLAVLGSASFPTGKKDYRFTTDSIDFGIDGLMTLDMTGVDAFVPWKLHVNAGYTFNRNEDEGYGILNTSNPNLSGFYPPAYPPVPEGKSASFNDLFRLGAGVEFLLLDKARLFVEFRWDDFIGFDETLPDSFPLRNTSMYTITPGFSLYSRNNVGIQFALDVNLNSESNQSIMNPPDWMAYFMLNVGGFVLPQDADRDGIEDKVDACPGEPEDFDGYQDDDGCPDLDNDGDGIPDDADQCPDLAEDFDGYQDDDGCPDLDNDGDGIADVDDRCPNEPEDFDGFEDSDGCPDVLQDSDGDGVPDDMDKCPLKPEDIDGFQDDDGCPDLDNDLDGILDVDDQCPNEPETFNGYEDEDGCPDERPIEQKFILRGVNFESGSAALTPDSYSTLDQVVKSLTAYPEVKVEIRGYTDSVGEWEYNLGLSQRRADSVKTYLVNSGVPAERILAKGYGEADPVSSNSTAAGRAENRRIEFHRLN